MQKVGGLDQMEIVARGERRQGGDEAGLGFHFVRAGEERGKPCFKSRVAYLRLLGVRLLPSH